MNYINLLKFKKILISLIIVSTTLMPKSTVVCTDLEKCEDSDLDIPKTSVTDVVETPVQTISDALILEKPINKYEFYAEKYENQANEIIEMEKNLEIAEYESMIEFYSKVYHLDYQIVLTIIKDLTTEFRSSDFVSENKISVSTIKGKEIDFTSKEFAILVEIRNIYYNYSDYGYSSEEIIKTDYEEETKTYEEQILEISKIVGVDPILVYSICYSESGFKSDQFVYNHNPSGIRFSSGFAVFPTEYSGFIEICLEMLKYNINGLETIEQIGAVYAPVNETVNEDGSLDVESSYNIHWISNVSATYKRVENEIEIFAIEETTNLTR